MKARVRKAELKDAREYAKHLLRIFRSRGVDDVIVNPFPVDKHWDLEEAVERIERSWEREPLSPGYENVWLLVDAVGNIVGHIDLTISRMEQKSHRCRLGMGIEADYRSKGYGNEMVRVALDWAKKQSQLAWIDLGVFGDNIVAQKLYSRLGFQVVAKIEDEFRVEGESIDNIQMTFDLRKN